MQKGIQADPVPKEEKLNGSLEYEEIPNNNILYVLEFGGDPDEIVDAFVLGG